MVDNVSGRTLPETPQPSCFNGFNPFQELLCKRLTLPEERERECIRAHLIKYLLALAGPHWKLGAAAGCTLDASSDAGFPLAINQLFATTWDDTRNGWMASRLGHRHSIQGRTVWYKWGGPGENHVLVINSKTHKPETVRVQCIMFHHLPSYYLHTHTNEDFTYRHGESVLERTKANTHLMAEGLRPSSMQTVPHTQLRP